MNVVFPIIVPVLSGIWDSLQFREFGASWPVVGAKLV